MKQELKELARLSRKRTITLVHSAADEQMYRELAARIKRGDLVKAA
jgi:hypothetical protein